MAIEFFCPGCGNLMRTPDETGGRKGRCPNCQTKVQIPDSSVKTSQTSSASAAEPQPKAPSTIELTCGSCGRTLRVPSSSAGKKGKCPNCAAIMSIPAQTDRWKGTPKPAAKPIKAKPAPTRKPEPAKPVASKPAAPATPPGGKIEFRCSQCQKLVRVMAAAAGQMGQCPQCNAVIKIPTKSTATPGLTPLPSAPSSAATSGLTPIGNTNASAPATPGLTPIGGAASSGGLTPLPADDSSPFGGGLTPIGDAGLDSLDDLGGFDLGAPAANSGFQAANPYAAPGTAAVGSFPQQAVRRKQSASPAVIACGVLIAIVGGGNILLLLINLVVTDVDAQVARRVEMQGGDEAQQAATAVGYRVGFYGASFVCFVGSCLTLAGGIQTARLKTRGLCITSAILAMLPCGCFCLLGIPIGIWGLILLNQDSVSSAFS